jgi:hypothetical protein
LDKLEKIIARITQLYLKVCFTPQNELKDIELKKISYKEKNILNRNLKFDLK